MSKRTMSEVVVNNVETLLRWRGMTRKDLADRMGSIGIDGWSHEKAIRRLLNGESSIPVDRLVALALCLQTTLETLTTPGIDWHQESPDHWQEEVVIIGTKEIPADRIALTIDGDSRVSAEPIGYTEHYLVWSDNEEEPKWTSPPGVAAARSRYAELLRDEGIEFDEDVPFEDLLTAFLGAFGRER